jgi:hypothetical protein
MTVIASSNVPIRLYETNERVFLTDNKNYIIDPHIGTPNDLDLMLTKVCLNEPVSEYFGFLSSLKFEHSPYNPGTTVTIAPDGESRLCHHVSKLKEDYAFFIVDGITLISADEYVAFLDQFRKIREQFLEAIGASGLEKSLKKLDDDFVEQQKEYQLQRKALVTAIDDQKESSGELTFDGFLLRGLKNDTC